MKSIGTAAALAASACMAATASAQLVLAFDINGFDYRFSDPGGTTGFSGVGHTGAVDWSYHTDPATVIADTRMGEDGRFGELFEVALGQDLAGFEGNINLSSGDVAGGSFTVTLDNGDTYTAQVDPGSGELKKLDVGGYTLDALTFNGAFSDDTFGDIDVSEFFRIQGEPGQLIGSLFQFRFDADIAPEGTGDMEVYVLVPLPPSAYAGIATLAGVMGLTYIRRRR